MKALHAALLSAAALAVCGLRDTCHISKDMQWLSRVLKAEPAELVAMAENGRCEDLPTVQPAEWSVCRLLMTMSSRYLAGCFLTSQLLLLVAPSRAIPQLRPASSTRLPMQ